jgi:septal ring factor EnvC (AmiA/AmiB activator)
MIRWILIVALYVPSAKAQTMDQKIVTEIENVKGEFSRDEIKQSKILSQLKRTNQRIEKLVQESSQLDQKRMLVEAASNDLQKKIATLSEKTGKQKALLANRLTAIYKFGGQGMARLIFSSQSASDLDRNLKILSWISARDLALIKDWTANKKDLLAKQTKLVARLEKIKNLNDQLRTKELKLEQENQYRTKILAAIKSSKKFKKTKLAALKQKYQNDAEVLDLLIKPTLFSFKGKLDWPVTGKVRTKFGYIEDTNYGVGYRNSGIFIESPLAQPVKSVFEGRIAFQGVIEGFGKTVIIDHGDHFFTVYAHLAKIVAALNESVKAGQVIAHSGQDPMEQKYGIHFELRHFAEPYDPTRWMKGIHL